MVNIVLIVRPSLAEEGWHRLWEKIPANTSTNVQQELTRTVGTYLLSVAMQYILRAHNKFYSTFTLFLFFVCFHGGLGGIVYFHFLFIVQNKKWGHISTTGNTDSQKKRKPGRFSGLFPHWNPDLFITNKGPFTLVHLMHIFWWAKNTGLKIVSVSISALECVLKNTTYLFLNAF